jgi:Lar family restriction alleviation protein
MAKGFEASPLVKTLHHWQALDAKGDVLPCPFCGSPAYTMPCDPEPAARVQCGGSCEATMYSPYGREHAVAAWNRRV